MNERLKVLADQAEDYATAEYEKWTPTHDFSGIPHIRKIFNEKFAELIVRECAGVCVHRYSHNHKDNSEGAFAAIACSDDILEHFGVEE